MSEANKGAAESDQVRHWCKFMSLIGLVFRYNNKLSEVAQMENTHHEFP